MKSLLFDTNIILDIALHRKPFVDHAFELFNLIDQNIITAFITATTITDIYYIANRRKGHTEALNFLKDLINIVDIVGVGKSIIIDAMYSEVRDFEDAIQSSAATSHKIDIIITRNKDDFDQSSVTVLTPTEFLEA